MTKQTLISKEKLSQAICQGYGFESVKLQFLQRGWGGDCYLAETDCDQRFFLKLHDDANYVGIAPTRRPFYLPLMDQLHTKKILPWIPHPIPTLQGNLCLQISPFEVVMMNFIEGEIVGFGKLPEPVLAQLAKMVALLHDCQAQLEFDHPFIEQYKIEFETELINSFDRLALIPTKDSQHRQFLRQTLLSIRDAVLAYLRQLKELQKWIRSIDKQMVVCHTDLHGGNLMTGQPDSLFILDWENAMIAPPEHDMVFFAGDDRFWDVFWPIYTHQIPQAILDSEVLRFYYYRRGLEDITGFILRILRGDGSKARDQEDVNWILECLKGLSEIEKTLEVLKTKQATNW